MKNFLVGLTMVCFIALFAVSGLADGEETKILVVKTAHAPVIDGTLSSGEWDDAVEYVLDKDTAAENFGGDGSDVEMLFYLLWDKTGLYIGAQVQDDTVAPSVRAGSALNVTDGIQLGLNPTNKAGDLISDAYFFSFVPASNTENDGPAAWYEHFMYMGAPESSGVQAAGERDAAGYTVEAFIPWTAINSKGENFSPLDGTEIGAAFTNMDFSPNKTQLSGYKTWPGWSITEYNTMVLCAADLAIPVEIKEATKPFTSAADIAEPEAEPAAGGTDTSAEENPEFSLIVFIFAFILFGTVLIAVNKWEETSK